MDHFCFVSGCERLRKLDEKLHKIGNGMYLDLEDRKFRYRLVLIRANDPLDSKGFDLERKVVGKREGAA